MLNRLKSHLKSTKSCRLTRCKLGDFSKTKCRLNFGQTKAPAIQFHDPSDGRRTGELDSGGIFRRHHSEAVYLRAAVVSPVAERGEMIHSNWVLKLKVLWHVERDPSADGCRARTSSTGRAVKVCRLLYCSVHYLSTWSCSVRCCAYYSTS